MSFALDWLDLREPADHAARDARLLAAAASFLCAGSRAPVAVDLGAGSGSTVRAFGALAGAARWRLVDNDAGLLSAAAARLGERVEPVERDLRAVDTLPLAGARLVTASALLDLVGADWIARLADRLAAERLAVYAALNYDGSMAWEPGRAEDAAVIAVFNAHQRRDKGFGPALGPEAAPALAAALTERGYWVKTAASPWRLGPGQGLLQAALAEGIARAVVEAGLARVEAWGQARRAEAMAGGSSCNVGHIDLLAVPG